MREFICSNAVILYRNNFEGTAAAAADFVVLVAEIAVVADIGTVAVLLTAVAMPVNPANSCTRVSSVILHI